MEIVLAPIATGVALYQLIFWIIGFALLVLAIYRFTPDVINFVQCSKLPCLTRSMFTLALIVLSIFSFAFTSSQRAPKLSLEPRVNNERVIEEREIVVPEPRTERLDGFRPLGE